MVTLKSFEEPSHIPGEWCSLVTVPEMKGLIWQLENKLYCVRFAELDLSVLSREEWEVACMLCMSRYLHMEKTFSFRDFLSLLTKTEQGPWQRIQP